MKNPIGPLLAATLLLNSPFAAAQGNVDSTVYVTVDEYETCIDAIAGTDTITSTIVQTTCPLCTDMPHTGQMGNVHTTVYTTKWATLCSTGWSQATYTVTETCTGPTPSWNAGPDYIPPGYTTTITVCTVCNGPKPTTVTMTVPCGSTPAGNVGPAPTGAGSGGAAPGGQPGGPDGAPAAPGSNAAAPGGGAAGPAGSAASAMPSVFTKLPMGNSTAFWNGTLGATTTTTTKCPGTEVCHHNTDPPKPADPAKPASMPGSAGVLDVTFVQVIAGIVAAAAGVLLF